MQQVERLDRAATGAARVLRMVALRELCPEGERRGPTARTIASSDLSFRQIALAASCMPTTAKLDSLSGLRNLRSASGDQSPGAARRSGTPSKG